MADTQSTQDRFAIMMDEVLSINTQQFLDDVETFFPNFLFSEEYVQYKNLWITILSHLQSIHSSSESIRTGTNLDNILQGILEKYKEMNDYLIISDFPNWSMRIESFSSKIGQLKDLLPETKRNFFF